MDEEQSSDRKAESENDAASLPALHKAQVDHGGPIPDCGDYAGAAQKTERAGQVPNTHPTGRDHEGVRGEQKDRTREGTPEGAHVNDAMDRTSYLGCSRIEEARHQGRCGLHNYEKI
jgi:hypothetical protein